MTVTDPKGARSQATLPSPIPPSRAELEAALADATDHRDWSTGRVEIVEREFNPNRSSFLTEVLTCRDEAGEVFKLLAKYGDRYAGRNQTWHEGHGQRLGVAYEANAYRRLPKIPGADTARYFATGDRAQGSWLFIEYLDGSYSLPLFHDPEEAIRLASTWLAHFHRECEQVVAESGLPWLRVYDRNYFAGWADRFAQYVDVVEEDYSWASDLASALFPALEPLLQGPTTVVHGEFYPNNVLVFDDRIYPVDWETVALGAGELDLASLIDNWPAEICEVALDIYAETRWGNAEQPGFRDRIELARVYQDLRWLGDRRERTAAPNEQRRFASLHDRAVRLGVL